jgi:hypothetical protein
VADGQDDPQLYENYQNCRKLMSSLMVDLQLVGLWNGKLDKEAMQDWSRYLQTALGKKRDRNLNEWAKLGYILSLLTTLFQGAGNDMAQLFVRTWKRCVSAALSV